MCSQYDLSHKKMCPKKTWKKHTRMLTVVMWERHKKSTGFGTRKKKNVISRLHYLPLRGTVI